MTDRYGSVCATFWGEILQLKTSIQQFPIHKQVCFGEPSQLRTCEAAPIRILSIAEAINEVKLWRWATVDVRKPVEEPRLATEAEWRRWYNMLASVTHCYFGTHDSVWQVSITTHICSCTMYVHIYVQN